MNILWEKHIILFEKKHREEIPATIKKITVLNGLIMINKIYATVQVSRKWRLYVAAY